MKAKKTKINSSSTIAIFGRHGTTKQKKYDLDLTTLCAKNVKNVEAKKSSQSISSKIFQI
jgi:hypothetical protein